MTASIYWTAGTSTSEYAGQPSKASDLSNSVWLRATALSGKALRTMAERSDNLAFLLVLPSSSRSRAKGASTEDDRIMDILIRRYTAGAQHGPMAPGFEAAIPPHPQFRFNSTLSNKEFPVRPGWFFGFVWLVSYIQDSVHNCTVVYTPLFCYH